ncbi:MAG TPA: amylo-alpha-1,6-glucosidase [Steroidobacteraceae bacterium]|nr:amylo-alpha-1,6-glucosidase [Steroidobacteraceae bacterium]
MGGLSLDRTVLSDFGSASAREWLVTNGLGGFAAGTLSGARTRRYHGLLVAALNPPVGRVVTLAKVDEVVTYAGRIYSLGANEFADGTIAPSGHVLLQSFTTEDGMPVWRCALGDALLEKRIWMAQGVNTTYVRYRLLRASAPLELELQPLCTSRDYHAQWRGGGSPVVTSAGTSCTIRVHEGAAPYQLTLDRGEFRPDAAWYWNFRHRCESARGLDDLEDLYRPGLFQCTLAPGEDATLTVSTEQAMAARPNEALAATRAYQAGLLATVDPDAPAWIRRLHVAADQFIVRRASSATVQGTTLIAGYPWFSDWGRDTMIALPGLTLATRRFAAAAQILRTFAEHVSEGMLPNRFPDAGETPEYNTVDATLWYFHAIDAYSAASGDPSVERELYPILKDIVRWHRAGTRYSIHADPDDGLLYAGEPGVQLTWMDARVGERVITPRTGKPVEINALWFNALMVMSRIARASGDRAGQREYLALAQEVAASLRTRFWFAGGGYLYDVIDAPGDPSSDASLRPNQLFAVSLPHSALEPAMARGVVDTCARELLTPVGLRSLARGDAAYAGRYAGGPQHRDSVYHQGTVWSWLLGPFALAHYRVYGEPLLARSFLDGLEGHLDEACIGSISEVFDGEPPHHPEGCCAQAWSVGETLRAWSELSAPQRRVAREPRRGGRSRGTTRRPTRPVARQRADSQQEISE